MEWRRCDFKNSEILGEDAVTHSKDDAENENDDMLFDIVDDSEEEENDEYE